MVWQCWQTKQHFLSTSQHRHMSIFVPKFSPILPCCIAVSAEKRTGFPSGGKIECFKKSHCRPHNKIMLTRPIKERWWKAFKWSQQYRLSTFEMTAIDAAENIWLVSQSACRESSSFHHSELICYHYYISGRYFSPAVFRWLCTKSMAEYITSKPKQ